MVPWSHPEFLMPGVHCIDDYAKDGGPGEVWLLCSFYHERLRIWIETIVNKFVSNHTALILGVHALRSYLKLICEYELHTLPNKKVILAKDHGKNYIKVRPPLVRHLLRSRLLLQNQNANWKFGHQHKQTLCFNGLRWSVTTQYTITLKMADQGWSSDRHLVFTMILCGVNFCSW